MTEHATNVTDAVAGLLTDIQARSDAVQAFIQHHMVDSHTLTLFGWAIPLPGFLTVHVIMLILSSVLLISIFALGYPRREGAPSGLANFLESIVQFVRDNIVLPYLGPEDGPRMVPVFLTFFTFILLTNLLGLVPILSTATSNLGVTAALASVTFIFMVAGAIWKNGPIGFVKGFIPHGVPKVLLPLLVPIEVFGLVVKTFALTIRLFANMLAGHIVVYALIGVFIIYGYAALPVAMLAVFIYLLEVLVAVFQAYIFTLLSAVFIGQRYNPEH